jgi:hypothetical protein
VQEKLTGVSILIGYFQHHITVMAMDMDMDMITGDMVTAIVTT